MMITSCLFDSNGNKHETTRLNRYHHLNNINGYRKNNNIINDDENSSDNDIRTIRLKRVGNLPLGFSIRGGWEYGTGIFVSELSQGSEAEKEGLRAGDQILRVNGFVIEQAIHDEVIALINSSSRITLKVRSNNKPCKEFLKDSRSPWKLFNLPSICPVHSSQNNSKQKCSVTFINNNNNSNNNNNNTTNNNNNNSNNNNNNNNTNNNNSNNYIVDKKKTSISSYAINNDQVEDKIICIKVKHDEIMGCTLVKGPSDLPGLFVQNVFNYGIAHESGIEIGDQIIAINGIPIGTDDVELDDALQKLRAPFCKTLSIRKKTGFFLFLPSNQSAFKSMKYSPICLKYSSRDSSSSPSIVCSNQPLYKLSDHNCFAYELKNNEKRCINKEITCNTQRIYEQVKKEEERIAEEKKKLENEQKRVQEELDRLNKERKQLESIKSSREGNSVSNGNVASSVQSIESKRNASKVGFLDEIKKMAEKRRSEDGLITDTLNKTKNLEKIASKNKLKITGQDDESRKRHEILMKEFRVAHQKMFSKKDNCGDESTKTSENIVTTKDIVKDTDEKLMSIGVNPNDNVTILHNNQKKANAIPSSKKSSIVKISSYGYNEENHYIIDGNKKNMIKFSEKKTQNSTFVSSQAMSNSSHPISIKINLS